MLAKAHIGTLLLLGGLMPWHNTQLAGIWRESARAIAAANDGTVAAVVSAWRDATRKPQANPTAGTLPPAAARYDANTIYNAHNSTHRSHLCDLVHFLIWQKLCRESKGPLPDCFLGVTDLTEYLLGEGYAPDVVDKFIAALGPSFPCGDLRYWLCRSRHRYSDQQLDRHLLEDEIENLRRTNERLEDQLDAHLMQQIPRGFPGRIWTWAAAITFSLATGDCNCADAFDTPETGHRGYHEAEKRCREAHFLSTVNLDREEEQNSEFADPLVFVARAVSGRCSVARARGFAQSMFCIVYDTPGEGKLRLAQHRGAYVLTETVVGVSERIITVNAGQEAGPQQQYVCYGCPDCKVIISPNWARRCRRENHPWVWGKIISDGPLHGEWFRVGVNACQGQHVWPRTQEHSCPVCLENAIAVNRIADVFAPTELGFDKVRWSWTAAELQVTYVSARHEVPPC